MKLTKVQRDRLARKIRHLTGECMCPAGSKTCPYWKMVDSGKEDWQAEAIIKEIENL